MKNLLIAVALLGFAGSVFAQAPAVTPAPVAEKKVEAPKVEKKAKKAHKKMKKEMKKAAEAPKAETAPVAPAAK